MICGHRDLCTGDSIIEDECLDNGRFRRRGPNFIKSNRVVLRPTWLWIGEWGQFRHRLEAVIFRDSTHRRSLCVLFLDWYTAASRGAVLPSCVASSRWSYIIEIVSAFKGSSVSCCWMRLALGVFALFEGGRCRPIDGEGVPWVCLSRQFNLQHFFPGGKRIRYEAGRSRSKGEGQD
jgi:hypothetical protein